MPAERIPDPDLFLSRIQKLCAEHIARLDSGGAGPPIGEGLLRELHEQCRRLESALMEERGDSLALGRRLTQRFGTGAERSAPAGPGAPDAGSDSGFAALRRRLAEHAPPVSRYEHEGEIARGGMGVIHKVWDADLRRHLAMKLVLGCGGGARPQALPHTDDQQLARFLEEAQVTGQLDHPGIVPVHELGLDEQGCAYFTMKLVKGRDLKAIFDLVFEGRDGWSETRALGVILKVCEALSYAHAKGVIHRDLKPANVMVGGFGEVYVMDWGLARVLGRKDVHDLRLVLEEQASSELRTDRSDERVQAHDSPLLTMDGTVVGTPAYMPPEQARSEVERLSPRSDVYAIGALLYHLLGRQAPFVDPGTRPSPRAILWRVIEGAPRPLAELRPGLPGELVAIVEKAMAREPDRRYGDMSELAADLAAFLEHRVVGAYETGTWAETKKWIGRNRWLAASLAALVVALAAGLAGTWTQAERADARAAEALANLGEARRQTVIAEANAELARERKSAAEAATLLAERHAAEAKERADETRLVAEFQTRILSALSVEEFGHVLVSELRREAEQGLRRVGRSDQEVALSLEGFDRAVLPANPTNVAQLALSRTLFEPAVGVIEREYAGRPAIQAVLQTPLSGTLKSLGLYDLGAKAASAAVDHRRQALGDEHVDTLAAVNRLGVLLLEGGRAAEAELLLRRSVETCRARLGDLHPSTLDSIQNLAAVLRSRGEHGEAEALFREALAGRRSVLGDDHPDTLSSIDSLACLLRTQVKLAEAEPLAREALERSRAVLGNDDPRTLGVINNSALLLQVQGRPAEAGALLREALLLRRATLGDQHPETLNSIHNLAHHLKRQGQLVEAEPLMREALAGCRAKLGNDHPHTLASLNNLAALLHARGELAGAEALYRELIALSRQKLGDDHPNTSTSLVGLAVLLEDRGELGEAEELLREAVGGSRAKLGDDHPATLNAINSLAMLLERRGVLVEAEALHREALAGRRARLGDDHQSALISLANLAGVLWAQNRFEQAEPLYRELAARRSATLGRGHPQITVAVHNLARVLDELGRHAEAEPLYREVLAELRTRHGDCDPRPLATQHYLAELLRAEARLEEAEPLAREALDGRATTLGSAHPDTRKSLELLLQIHADRHAQEPDGGHEQRARELRTRFAR